MGSIRQEHTNLKRVRAQMNKNNLFDKEVNFLLIYSVSLLSFCINMRERHTVGLGRVLAR